MNRICKVCGVDKKTEAFVGSRCVCRACWHYLSKDEKDSNKLGDTSHREYHRNYRKMKMLKTR